MGEMIGMPELTVLRLEMFFLLLVRISILVYLLPFMTGRNVPRMVKNGLSFFLTIVVFPLAETEQFPFTPELYSFFALLLEEIYVGVVIGFAASFLFSGISLGGSILTREMGMGRIRGQNPVTEERVDGVSQFLILIFSVVFLVSNGHYFFVKALADSVEIIPLGALVLHPEPTASLFISMTAAVFLVGLKVAAPILALLLVTVLGMAFVSRIMPQMNVWFVMIPVKIIMGVSALGFLLPMTYKVFEQSFDVLQDDIYLLMRLGRNVG